MMNRRSVLASIGAAFGVIAIPKYSAAAAAVVLPVPINYIVFAGVAG